MTGEQRRHDDLLDRVVDLELAMFEAVREERPSSCRDMPKAFKVMRSMTHSVLSAETLRSYLRDLEQATADGRNLMTEKYARMEGLIPRRDDSPVIDRIVRMERGWQDELSDRYPQLFEAQSMQTFELYLRSELETYSHRTLELYLRDVYESAEENRNLGEERYTLLARMLGHDSIPALFR
jgi:hypothetical protein